MMKKATRENTPKTKGKAPTTDFIIRPVTITRDLCEFADEKVKRIAQATGEPANLSKYIRDLVREDKQREEAAAKA